MEAILKSILKTESEAEALTAKAKLEAKKIVDKGERDAAAVGREFADKKARKVKEIDDAACKTGEAARDAVMRQASDAAAAVEAVAVSRFDTAAQACLEHLLG
ncbi:MAG TPA: hypothetical protein P5287_04425 [bacterium]|nr:hypothetical protein [bacterium]